MEICNEDFRKMFIYDDTLKTVFLLFSARLFERGYARLLRKARKPVFVEFTWEAPARYENDSIMLSCSMPAVQSLTPCLVFLECTAAILAQLQYHRIMG